MEIKYRLGKKEDSKQIAEMIDIASDGIVSYLFQDLVSGMSPVEVLAHNLENDNYPHTYSSTLVACDGDEKVGMALSYPSSEHKITDETRSFFPADRLEHLSGFYSSRIENSWFLDTLCVIESHRRRGIGEKLISLTKENALENGYNTLSLIVFADNALAISVYQHTGFEVIQKVELRGNKFIKHQDGCLLMKCEITT
ncbi:MAG: GNAT family N-acetyltransferase [Xenococcaceae cyanobacterium MO_167.B27]|nr:GNAT family N-acetyltransferase [Xenococcaceae cyanobacterium MO_167.B27]